MSDPVVTATDFAALEPWLGSFLSRMQPGRRTMLARRVGQMLRRVNAARVAANLDPDGEPMAVRKQEKGRPPKGRARKGDTPIRQRGKRGLMFKRIELARNMVVTPGTDSVSLSFRPRVAGTAAIHHFGKVAPVDPRIPNSIRVRYTARRLLGFGADDRAALTASALEWLQGANGPL